MPRPSSPAPLLFRTPLRVRCYSAFPMPPSCLLMMVYLWPKHPQPPCLGASWPAAFTGPGTQDTTREESDGQTPDRVFSTKEATRMILSIRCTKVWPPRDMSSHIAWCTYLWTAWCYIASLVLFSLFQSASKILHVPVGCLGALASFSASLAPSSMTVTIVVSVMDHAANTYRGRDTGSPQNTYMGDTEALLDPFLYKYTCICVAPTWSVRELPRCTLSACTSASPTYCHHQPAQHASSKLDQGGSGRDGTTCGDRACVYSRGSHSHSLEKGQSGSMSPLTRH